VDVEYKNVESVDLTGDGFGYEHHPGSSSSVDVFGESTTLWTETAASRPEPLARTSKKRKSDERSPTRRSPKKIDTNRKPATIKEDYSRGLDGFVDIDDIPPRSSHKTALGQPVWEISEGSC
jgi:bloom syndrome protein